MPHDSSFQNIFKSVFFSQFPPRKSYSLTFRFVFPLDVSIPVNPEDDMSTLICLLSCVVLEMVIYRFSKDT